MTRKLAPADATNLGHVYRAVVGDEDAGQSVLAFHVARFRHSDEAAWRQSIALGRVRVNGRRADADDVLRAGDELEFHRPPWQEPDAPERFDVAFEDEDVLVVVKPAGLQVLPAGPFKTRTLLELVRASSPERAVAAPAHRLGRGTSGLIAFGKTPRGRSSLARQFRELSLVKTYLAWVEGARLPDSFAAREPIARVAHGPLKIFVAAERGKESLTRVRVLRRARAGERERALVAAQPITGRPDQIRIHLAAAGAPVVGDPLFGPGGTPKSDATPGAGGYLLHATALSFSHPATGERVRLRSLPEWLARE
ncbi:MAG TPA: pseudouridine synthase [Gammaproteobacteria bacterium]|jgi:23S rRNA pseudouridine1911/1915/1917 synthase|nr:pseudouridine synthase [Gammaproteobacteria bacterium]